jgi:dolichyl-phosphate beta-glucosyltransferase
VAIANASGPQPLRLSIVIPALNEATRLPSTLRRLDAYLTEQSYDWEIIVVSNGSTDGTETIVDALRGEMTRLRVISIAQRGKGVACRVGALESRGEALFLCDADLSMPPHHLDTFLRLLEGADIVVGSREAPGSHRFSEPWHRHVMGRVFNRVVQLVAVPGVNDTQCGFKMFRQSVARDLFAQQTLTGFGFDVELLYLARKYGYPITELGINWHFDSDTRVRPGIDTLAMLREIMMVRINDLRGLYRRPPVAPNPPGGTLAR